MSTKCPKAWTTVKVSKKIAERMVPLRLLSNLMRPVKKIVRKSVKRMFHNKNKQAPMMPGMPALMGVENHPWCRPQADAAALNTLPMTFSYIQCPFLACE